MSAPTENEFWKLRKDISEDGRKLSVNEIIEKAQEYIDYCRNNPLIEIDFQGGKKIKRPKMRAMTIQGLCHHLGIIHNTWGEWRKDPKYKAVTTHVESFLYNHKFEGAAAGFLNANIIARDLKLTDRKDLTSKGDKIQYNNFWNESDPLLDEDKEDNGGG